MGLILPLISQRRRLERASFLSPKVVYPGVYHGEGYLSGGVYPGGYHGGIPLRWGIPRCVPWWVSLMGVYTQVCTMVGISGVYTRVYLGWYTMVGICLPPYTPPGYMRVYTTLGYMHPMYTLGTPTHTVRHAKRAARPRAAGGGCPGLKEGETRG